MGGSSNKSYLSGTNASSGEPKGNPVNGGGGGDGGSGGGGAGDTCNITTSGAVRSPNPAVVSTLGVGQQLAIDVVAINGVDVLRAKTAAGSQVGVVDTADEQALLDCIGAGHVYHAEVKRISGGAITVVINRI